VICKELNGFVRAAPGWEAGKMNLFDLRSAAEVEVIGLPAGEGQGAEALTDQDANRAHRNGLGGVRGHE
jgi:hypothetical protein